MNIFMINLLSFIVCDCVTSTEQNVKIFHRNEDPDLHNGHAKPSQAEQQISSWHIINKKPAARTNKYFVTWRPDLGEEREEEEHRDILSTILAKHEGDQVNFKPQFYFSQDKVPTSKPLVNSVSPPSSPSPPTTPSWSYKPVFNKIFSSKYRPTFQPSTTTTTPVLSSTTITTTTTTTTTTISTTTVLTTRRSVVTTSSVLSVDQTLDDGILKPFQSNLPLQDETVPQSASSFITYIRDLLVTFLRFVANTLNGQPDQHSSIMDSQAAPSSLFSTKELATIVGFPMLTGLMLLAGAPVSAVLATAWLTPLLSMMSPDL